MQFKTNPALIKQVKQCTKVFDTTYFHGDGNFYDNERDSHFRKTFGNPGQEESKYRVIFKKGAKVPDTVEEMNRLLMESRQKEQIEDSKPKEVQVTKSLVMPDEDEDEEVETKGSKGKKETKKVEADAKVEA